MNHSRSEIEADRGARVQLSGKCHFWLDEPADWSFKVRNLRLEGWCVAKSGEPIVAIRARIHGRTFAGRFHRSRPEVREYLEMPDAPLRCGFGIDVRVPFGRSRLELQVARADGKWFKLFARDVRGPLRISAEERRILARRAQGDLYGDAPFFIDHPLPEEWDEAWRRLRITGWHFAQDGSPIREIRARIRGKTYLGKYGLLRPDIAAMHNGAVAALRSGFLLEVPAPVGRSKLILEAQNRDGVWREFFVRQLRGRLSARRYADDFEAVGNYAEWIDRYDRLSKNDIAQIRQHITQLARRRTFSVLLPVYNTDTRWLRRAIESVRAQLYPDWELCIIDDASTAPHVWPLLQRFARNDSRIKIYRRSENGHISVASNDALALASGEFVALLDHDDELAPTALYFAACALNEKPDVQLLYSDEDKLDKAGRRRQPYFKPDWNPDLFTAQNYISHLGIYATDLARRVGGFRKGFEGSQDYDLALRCVEQLQPAQIHHIPRVLYHWRMTEESTAALAEAKPYAREAARRAVQEHFERREIDARVILREGNYQHVFYNPPTTLVSIIIATRDRVALLRRCIETLRAKTAYKNFELVIVDNESSDPETRGYLRDLAAEGARVLRSEGQFNFSQLNNRGVAQARGEFIVLLNNDIEITQPDWLGEMLSHAARAEIGAVGARLWYPERKLQHGGVILGSGGVAAHIHEQTTNNPAYFGRDDLTQNFSAVTGACLAMHKELYQRLGGLDEVNLPVAFNDVDLCLRLREAGYRVVWTPHAQMIHHESSSRGLDDTEGKQRRFLDEVRYMQERWGGTLQVDPCYNLNLSLEPNEQFKLAFPPRVTPSAQ